MEALAPWTLDELSERVREALAASGLGQSNGQVSEVPNARTIRYYTTVGVLDRPNLSGRTAAYGQKHLEQLVAIKRLQARGLQLAEIQQRLLGLDPAGLTALAAVPPPLAGVSPGVSPAVSPATHGPVVPETPRRDGAFWGAEPAEPARPTSALATVPSALPLMPLVGLTLDGVTLAFPATRALDPDDTEALRAALESVAAILREKGLLPQKDEP